MKIWMKRDPYYRRRCSPIMISFWQNEVYADIRGGSLKKRQWGCRKWHFSVLFLLISSEALKVRLTLGYYIPSTGVTLCCRLTLNENSNSDMLTRPIINSVIQK